MLSNLHIENIAVIEKADVDFSDGFNVLTGETGAGKSIIIDSLNAILGQRTSKDLIRTGCSSAFVSALFTDISQSAADKLRELDFADEEDTDTVLLQRTISADGRGSFKINTRPATAAALREMGKYLVDIHGQHDNQFLLSSDYHYKFIDILAKNDSIYEDFIKSYNELKDIHKKRKSVMMSEEEKTEKINALRFCIDELEKAKLQKGEKDELTAREAVIKNNEKISNALNQGNIILSGDENTDGVVAAVSGIANILISVSGFHPKIKDLSERLLSVSYELSDCADELSSLSSNISYDYNEAEKTEERLDLLYRLSKKYNKSEDELVDYLEDAKKELSDFSSSEEMLQRLNLEFEAKRQETIEKAFKLSESRKTAAKEFEKKVAAQMRYLDMPHAVFSVDFKTKTLDKLGLDRIEFLISLNPGEELKPLSSVASGGELSRIMLSIKNVLSDRDFVQTMIFDEIDSGTSGKAASKIGKKLKETARGKQIICITHLAQIAALADTHLLVEKKVKNNKTLTSVRVLDYRERCAEIARIMGGENITESTMKAAKEMLDKSVDFDF